MACTTFDGKFCCNYHVEYNGTSLSYLELSLKITLADHKRFCSRVNFEQLLKHHIVPNCTLSPSNIRTIIHVNEFWKYLPPKETGFSKLKVMINLIPKSPQSVGMWVNWSIGLDYSININLVHNKTYMPIFLCLVILRDAVRACLVIQSGLTLWPNGP